MSKGINPKTEYDLSGILALEVLPVKDIRTLRKLVQRDLWGENLLKAEIQGEGRGMRYRIRGANIIKFLDKYGPGFAMRGHKRIT